MGNILWRKRIDNQWTPPHLFDVPDYDGTESGTGTPKGTNVTLNEISDDTSSNQAPTEAVEHNLTKDDYLEGKSFISPTPTTLAPSDACPSDALSNENSTESTDVNNLAAGAKAKEEKEEEQNKQAVEEAARVEEEERKRVKEKEAEKDRRHVLVDRLFFYI